MGRLSCERVRASHHRFRPERKGSNRWHRRRSRRANWKRRLAARRDPIRGRTRGGTLAIARQGAGARRRLWQRRNLRLEPKLRRGDPRRSKARLRTCGRARARCGLTWCRGGRASRPRRLDGVRNGRFRRCRLDRSAMTNQRPLRIALRLSGHIRFVGLVLFFIRHRRMLTKTAERYLRSCVESSMRHFAANPRMRGPSRVAVGVGRHPRFNRASRSSSAVGHRDQTATAVKPPSHVVS